MEVGAPTVTPEVVVENGPPPRLMTINQACSESGFGRSFVYDQIAAGQLIARRFGKATRILRTDFELWIETRPRLTNITTKGPHA
ncbi:MAG TPA: helix-turn-helix domain-containing protein [Caulobacteraceae bacterium]|nr:helix-turn-helix domain-containing protein [Caulobacteraceae bacterium]